MDIPQPPTPHQVVHPQTIMQQPSPDDSKKKQHNASIAIQLMSPCTLLLLDASDVIRCLKAIRAVGGKENWALVEATLVQPSWCALLYEGR
ncbi:hypothetical protein Pmani_020411 [Petrolisthes manimaculis]|uniref:Uncharacterized protein n=1 Tax=Petrolisthes manimaculis TaxID=1843537 RepID=A0AAE1PIF5_9EUCA|nr:hypothetical protein Pmani_020411 [Petrolisthes manimaculis]